MNIENTVLQYKDDIIRDLQQLVAIRSVRAEAQEGMPAGRESFAALAYMLDRAKQMGFETTNVDGYMGYASYGKGTEYIAVIGHLDIVPEGEGWKHDPFGGEIEKGKLYGRGTTDNKGSSVAALYCLKVLKDLGCPCTKEVRAMFGTMEESGMEDMIYYLSKNPEPVMALVPDAGYPVYNKQRGPYFFKMECSIEDSAIISANGGDKMGVVPGEASCVINAHGVDPDLLQQTADGMCGEKSNIELEKSGDTIRIKATGLRGSTSYGHNALNANLLLLDFLVKALGEKVGRRISLIHDLFKMETDGKSLGLYYDGDAFGIVSVGMCKIDITDGIGEFWIDIRFPANQKLQDIQSRIARLFEGYKVTPVKEYEAHYVPEDSELCRILSKVYEEVTNDKTQYICNYGMNYSRFIRNGVAYGNCFKWDDPSPSHGADEFIPIDSLIRHCVIHTKALIQMMK